MIDKKLYRLLFRLERDLPEIFKDALRLHNVSKVQWEQAKKDIGNHYDK